MRPLVVLLFALLLAAPARAAGPELGIADDRVLLAGGPEADAMVSEWQELGIEQVRIYALWSRIGGPSPAAANDWTQLDHAVDRVVAAGMKPLLTITGPGPLWSSRRAERGDPRYDPDPELYADFARAVAERYGDRVDRYVLWNEPNLGSWLRPQAACFGKVCRSVAPHLYRELVRAAYPAVHAADPGAQVLIGAMSSRGTDLRSENSTHRPLAFLRALGCVDTAFKKVRNGRCAGFKPAKGDGFAFHPHFDAPRGRPWGQVRRRDARTVNVQRRLAGSSKWRTVATRSTDSRGYWSWATRLLKGASYRYVTANATSATLKRG
jgi:hypothetical protein